MALTFSSFSSISSVGKKKEEILESLREGEWDEDPVKETATTNEGDIGKHTGEMWTK